MTTSIIISLRQTCRSCSDHIDYPKQPGIYGFVLADKSTLGQFGQGGQLLYVGISKDSLHSRDFNQHFKAGQSGRSTLRRSLGAALKDKLRLKAIPRGGASDTKRFDNYKFTADSEERLTAWMLQNLKIGYWVFTDTMDYKLLRQHEDAVIRELRPTLDLDPRTKKLNPLADALTALRQVCKDEAKRNS